MAGEKLLKAPLGPPPRRRSKASRNFVIALSLVSIFGFINIMGESMFSFSIGPYLESLWLLVLGGGLIFETTWKELRHIKEEGLSSEMLGKITMIVVGLMAVVAALFSLPQLYLEHPTFLAVKGIISILAIIFIIIQTWITKEE